MSSLSSTVTQPDDHKPVAVSSPTLGSLSPVEIHPEGRTHPPSTIDQLSQVERVQVVRLPATVAGAKNQPYAVNFYFCNEGSRIPAALKSKQPLSAVKRQTTSLSGEDCAPDLQLVWTVAQFCSLRNAVHSCVEPNHRGSRCGFCEQLNRHLMFGGGRSMLFVNLAFDVSLDASSLLTDFMNFVVVHCQSEASRCKGQRRLLSLLRAFVFGSLQ